MKNQTKQRKPKTALLVYMSEDLRREFKSLSAAQGKTMSGIAIEAILSYIQKESQK